MKKIILLTTLLISVFILSACGSTLVGDISEDGKSITITAKNSSAEDFITTGTLEVNKDERLIFDAQLTKGAMKIEFFKFENTEDINTIPDTGFNNPVYVKEISVPEYYIDSNIEEGSYMIKATTTEKADGIVKVLVNESNN